MGDRPLAAPIIGMASTTDAGLLGVATDGGIFALGDAQLLGSLGGQATPASPASPPTPHRSADRKDTSVTDGRAALSPRQPGCSCWGALCRAGRAVRPFDAPSSRPGRPDGGLALLGVGPAARRSPRGCPLASRNRKGRGHRHRRRMAREAQAPNVECAVTTWRLNARPRIRLVTHASYSSTSRNATWRSARWSPPSDPGWLVVEDADPPCSVVVP